MGLIPTQLLYDSKRRIDIIAKRQEALADNIANMHTVGYKRKDVDFSQFLTTGKASEFESRVIEQYGASPISNQAAGGENLTTEEEMSKMQENYIIYNVALRNLTSTITQIKSALNVSANG